MILFAAFSALLLCLVSVQAELSLAKTGRTVHSEQLFQEQEYPHVDDPAFPAWPIEFLEAVDSTCQTIVYNANVLFANMSDQVIIHQFGGCKQISRGFCQGTRVGKMRLNTTTTMMVYQRTEHGTWIAIGFKRQYREKCKLKWPWAEQKGFDWPDLRLFEGTNNNASPKRSHASMVLPRLPDLALPAPFPSEFIKLFPDECRRLASVWNVNYKPLRDEQIYPEDCQIVGGYCESSILLETLKLEQLFLRSTTGMYRILGIKGRGLPVPLPEKCRI